MATVVYHDGFEVGTEVWGIWVITTTATDTAAASFATLATAAETVWQGWNTTTITTTITMPPATFHQPQPVPQPLTPEEVVQREADRRQRQREEESRQRLHREQVRAEAARFEAAEQRAEQLLEMVLTTVELTQWQAEHQVTIRGGSGGRYLVTRRGVHGNIYEIDEHGCRLRSGCVAPAMYDDQGALPSADGWVGQILAIRHNEELFRATANWSYARACGQRTAIPAGVEVAA